MSDLVQISTPALVALREKLSGGAQWPPSASAPASLIAGSAFSTFSRAQMLEVLDIVIAERRVRAHDVDSVELVWSGPEEGVTETRETSVVLRELFLAAKKKIIIATYVFYDGESVFKDLAARVDQDESLEVRFLLHAFPKPDPVLARRECREAFRQNWPGKRLPTLFIDPRTTREAQRTTTMHAKFVAIDDEVVFLTSANFTEAAQERNVEAGVLVRQPAFALRLRRHFDGLLANGLIEKLQ